MASLMKRMLLDDSGFDATKRIVRAGGEVRYVRCVGIAVSDNVSSRRIGVGIDVTDHEVLTQELRRREAYRPKPKDSVTQAVSGGILIRERLSGQTKPIASSSTTTQ